MKYSHGDEKKGLKKQKFKWYPTWKLSNVNYSVSIYYHYCYFYYYCFHCDYNYYYCRSLSSLVYHGMLQAGVLSEQTKLSHEYGFE